VLAELLSESDVSTHLSYLLKRPVSFKLRITPNKELALIDVAILFTGLDNNHAGLAVRRLLEQFPDFHSNRVKFKFPGRGRQTVDVAPLAEALEFAFLLPGRNAAKVRKEAAKLLVRYLGGDLSLVDEIFLRNHVQAALAQIPEEERTAEQQTARLFGESVESTQPAPSIFHMPPPPIVMESCPTGCLDGGPPHFYILHIPSQSGLQEGEDGDIYRGGRTKDFDARLPNRTRGSPSQSGGPNQGSWIQAGKAVRRLLEQFPDVRTNSPNFEFPGRGQKAVEVPPLATENSSHIKRTMQGKNKKNLYIMSIETMPGLLKIGRAANVRNLKKSLERLQPFSYRVQVIFPDCGPLETIIHHTLDHLNKKDCPGKDWFYITCAEAAEVIVQATRTYAHLLESPTSLVKRN